MRKTFIIPVCMLVALVSLHEGLSWASTSSEYLREGYLSFVARSWDEAIALYTKAIQLNPKNADAYFQRGIAREMTDRVDDAVKDYAKTLELVPGHYLAMEYLAKLYEVKGEYGKSIDLYTQSLSLVDDTKWKSIIRAWITEARRKMKEAPSQATRDVHSPQPDLSSGMRQAR